MQYIAAVVIMQAPSAYFNSVGFFGLPHRIGGFTFDAEARM